jgi:Antibiotic biosynthesis monooxygenase
MKPGCTLIAYLHAKPKKRDELLQVLQSFIKPSRAEPVCVDYHLHVSNDDPNLFVFYESWRTREELDPAPADANSYELLVAASRLAAKGRRDPVHYHVERSRLARSVLVLCKLRKRAARR